MQATISLLPVSLSLVHIPRPRLPALAQQVLRQVLHPHPAFLNITSNDIELSIFAEHHILNDFEPIAQRDARRNRSEPVEISYDNWSVLQIDSHSDQLDNSGTRVHDLSAPLAAAGISILYQSSYMSDFIFVKESRLKEAMDLFEAAGFGLYHSNSEDADNEYDAPQSPVNYYSPSTDGGPDSPHYNPSIRSLSSTKKGAVLTRDDSQPNLSNNKKSGSSDDATTTSSNGGNTTTGGGSRHASPTSAEVRILPPDLACVGLSDEFGVDHWGLKIVKLVAFPDLIGPQKKTTSTSVSRTSFDGAKIRPRVTRSRSPPSSRSSSASSSRSTSASSEYASCDSSSNSVSGDEDGLFDHGSRRDRDTDSTSFTSLATTNNEQEDVPVASTVKGASIPNRIRIAPLSPLSPIVPPAPKIPVERPRISVHTQTTPEASTSSSRKSHRHRRRRENADKENSNGAGAGRASSTRTKPTTSSSSSSSTGTPFFGFTRTTEGSSLTAPTRVLAALFPSEERHMLICGSELDAADKWVERQAMRVLDGDDVEEDEEDDDASYLALVGREDDDVDRREEDEEGLGGRLGRGDHGEEEEEDADLLGAGNWQRHRYRGRGASMQRNGERSGWESRSRGRGDRRSRSVHGGASGALKCLQVDLRRFGLDKHGLVNRFSRVLEENEINHMYSSTFKTANLLVDKRDALRAQALLRTC